MKKTFIELKQSLEEIRQDLFSIMRRDNLSVYGLSKLMGITHGALTKFLNAQTNPRVTMIMRIEKFISDNK